MGISLNVHGIIPKDKKYESYESIYKKCNELNIECPDAVLEFFDEIGFPNADDTERRTPEGYLINLNEYYSISYVLIDLDKIDKNIKFIKVELTD